MKKLLVLGGGSLRNKTWVDECVASYADLFDGVSFIYYDHWETGEKNMDFEREAKKIKDIVSSSPDADWFVFAKSIGTILTFKLVLGGIVKPEKCILFGIPFNIVKDSVFDNDFSSLQDFGTPSLAFHNIDDPTADFNLASEVVAEYLPTVTLKELSGVTHDYLDFEDYKLIIDDFLES